MASWRSLLTLAVALLGLIATPAAGAQGTDRDSAEPEPGVEIDEEPLGKYEYDYPAARERKRTGRRRRAAAPPAPPPSGPSGTDQFGVGIEPKPTPRKPRRRRARAANPRRVERLAPEASRVAPVENAGFALGWSVLIPAGVILVGLGTALWLRRSAGSAG